MSGSIDGLLSTRTVALDRDKPHISLHTVLGNPTDRPLTTTICTHPVFGIDDVAHARVEMLTGGTVAESQTMDPSAIQGRGLWFNTPTGRWRLVDDSSGTAITSSFDASQVDKCLVCMTIKLRRALPPWSFASGRQ